eukprot:COSAG06_NODE_9919_length_1789_cov_94.811970_3_plen_53_part_00
MELEDEDVAKQDKQGNKKQQKQNKKQAKKQKRKPKQKQNATAELDVANVRVT